MKPFRLHMRLFLLLALLVLAAQVARAWPDAPPDRAFISGPGLDGDIEIKDKATLEALKLGSMEDFERRSITPPAVSGEGYKITRYFEGGSFNFATLYYYPNPEGPGYIFFEDGSDLVGNHTLYNNRWFYVTPQGEVAIQNLLTSLGVGTTPSAVTAPVPSVIEVLNRFSGWFIALVGSVLLIWFITIRRHQPADFNSR